MKSILIFFFLILLLAGCTDPITTTEKNDTVSIVTEKSDVSEADSSVAKPEDAIFEETESNITTSWPSGFNELLSNSDPDKKYRAGENPYFASEKGWPVTFPTPLEGSILPFKRVVAYYGNPLSRRMGVLGEYSKAEMLGRLQKEVKQWEKADAALPVQPALHLIAVVAQEEPGRAGKYRMIMNDDLVNQVYEWAREIGAILFIDIQTGHDDIRNLLPGFDWILQKPDVHLGIDPEFNLIDSKAMPGKKIGKFDAKDINYVSSYLKKLVKQHNLPPKLFVIHRFTQGGVTNTNKISLNPEVQIVMHMDGWGAPWLKRDTYMNYIVSEPVQFTGFKLFYHNDTKKGHPLMTPDDVLKLVPAPVYIQYQ